MNELTNLHFVLAIKVLDSSARSLDGLLEGTFVFLGQYDECMAVRYQNEHISGQGQYALMEMVPIENDTRPRSEVEMRLRKAIFSDNLYRLRVAICVPSECNAMDVDQLFQPGNFFAFHFNIIKF